MCTGADKLAAEKVCRRTVRIRSYCSGQDFAESVFSCEKCRLKERINTTPEFIFKASQHALAEDI